MSTVRISDVKQLDLVDFLAALGYHPERIRNEEYWYLSPLRNERTASFKVDRRRNVWYDHGDGRGGTIIDFGMAYYNCDIPGLLNKIKDYVADLLPLHQSPGQQSSAIDSDERKILVLNQRPIKEPFLIKYLENRSITLDVANQYCRETIYRVGSQEYSAIGFPNDKGGFELRSSTFKGSSSPKATTFFQAESPSLRIFEGFFDFLSFQVIQKTLELPTSNFLILNSLALLRQALPVIQRHSPILTFLDHDQAGRRATEQIRQKVPGALDASPIYRGAKDVNEWLINAGSKLKQPAELVAALRQIIRPEIPPKPDGSPRRRLR